MIKPGVHNQPYSCPEGLLHDPVTWYKITHARTRSHMLGRKLHCGISKTKQLVQVHLGLPSFSKSHSAICVPPCAM